MEQYRDVTICLSVYLFIYLSVCVFLINFIVFIHTRINVLLGSLSLVNILREFSRGNIFADLLFLWGKIVLDGCIIIVHVYTLDVGGILL